MFNLFTVVTGKRPGRVIGDTTFTVVSPVMLPFSAAGEVGANLIAMCAVGAGVTCLGVIFVGGIVLVTAENKIKNTFS